MSIESKAKAISAARASFDKKAKDVIILEVKELTIITEFFIICSAESTTQVKAIVDHIEEILRKSGIRPLRIEGLSFAHWALMDYGDVFVHVFEEQTRSYYELDKLWLDAPRFFIEDENKDILGRQDKGTVPY